MAYKLTRKDKEEIYKEVREYIIDLDETPSLYYEKFISLLTFIDGYIKGISRASKMLKTSIDLDVEILIDVGNILDEHFDLLKEMKVLPIEPMAEVLSKGTWKRIKETLIIK